MGLEKFHKKVNAYETRIQTSFKKTRNKIIKQILTSLIILGISSYIILETLNVTWYRILKIKLKYIFKNLM